MDKKVYCINVCNYLNNLKGDIEDYEIKNLLWCVFGMEDLENIEIPYMDYLNLSSDIRNDMGDMFYKDLCELANKVEEEQE